MRNTLRIIILSTLSCISVWGQQVAQVSRVVTWSSDPNCAVPYLTASAKDATCDSFVSDGETIRVIEDHGLFLAISFVQRSGFMVADVFINNNTSNRVLIEPANWVMITGDWKLEKSNRGTQKEDKFE